MIGLWEWRWSVWRPFLHQRFGLGERSGHLSGTVSNMVTVMPQVVVIASKVLDKGGKLRGLILRAMAAL
jgi:hypothetical protein